jgi:AmiR/NasT family two-component response regulator
MKLNSGTPRLLRELRSLRVVVFHPEDQDGQELIGQLQRIGCQVKAFWPPLERLPDEADLVFLAVRPEVLSVDLPWLRRENPPPVIAVVTYENPVIVEAVLRLNAYGVIASPVKSFGLLTSMVVAVKQSENTKDRARYVARLEQRLSGQRKIAKAKAILMQSRNISEEDAYNLIRNRAMTKRVTTEEIADAVIKANEILGFDSKTG